MPGGMPGGTNLPVLLGLGCGSQTPYPYDAYPRRCKVAKAAIDSLSADFPTGL